MKKITCKKIDKNKFYLELIIFNEIYASYVATSLLDRDKMIFDWCEMHDIVDIEHIAMDKIQNIDKEKEIDLNEIVPVIPYTDSFQLEDYFDDNNDYIFNRIIDSIADGIKHKRKKIKLFQINESGIFVQSLKRDWPAGLRVAHSYFKDTEDYKKCQKCIDLLKILKQKL